jgi:hypothetical protein
MHHGCLDLGPTGDTITSRSGAVSERLKERDWKSRVGATSPWVRIPPAPLKTPALRGGFCLAGDLRSLLDRPAGCSMFSIEMTVSRPPVRPPNHSGKSLATTLANICTR